MGDSLCSLYMYGLDSAKAHGMMYLKMEHVHSFLPDTYVPQVNATLSKIFKIDLSKTCYIEPF